MAIVIEATNNIRDLKTLTDGIIIKHIKEKLKADDISLTVSPQVYTACIIREEQNINILSSRIDKDIHTAAQYFEDNPPLNNTEALFAVFGELPMILALKDTKDEKHLNLQTTRDLCTSIGWIFFDPVEVKVPEDLLTMVFQGIDESMMRVAVWMNDSVYRLYSYDIGFLLGLYIPKPLREAAQETNKSTIWYWLLKQKWIAEFDKQTSSMGTFVDRMWSLIG